MTETTINIDVLQVFNLSIGKVYSIKFPPGVIPSLGIMFSFGERSWKVRGITSTNRLRDENVWDCIITPDTDCSDDLPQGICTIEVIDLK